MAPSALIRSASADSGYLNILVHPTALVSTVIDSVLRQGPAFGTFDFGKGKTIYVEYSSPNIAKPFHAGHLRSTVIGLFLAKLHRACGYTVVSENYLGDWEAVRLAGGRVSQELFLTCHAPFRRLSAGALYHLDQFAVAAPGHRQPKRGPHALRHANATYLLNSGFSLKAVGDHLGHRNLSTTRVYAKVDLVGLRAVAAFDLGGLL